MSKTKLSVAVVVAVLVAVQAAAGQEQAKEGLLYTLLDRTNAGLKYGLNFPSMSYSNDAVDAYSSAIYPKVVFELFAEYPLWRSLWTRPGFKYTIRGQHIEEKELTYKLDASYYEINLPVFWMFNDIKNVHPYLLFGPVFGFASSGEVRYDRMSLIYGQGRSYRVDLNTNNFSSYAIGLFLGLGARYPLKIQDFPIIPGFEVGYHLGLTNTYSDKELKNEVTAINKRAYNIVGYRTNRGLEFGGTISIPLELINRKSSPSPQPAKPAPVSGGGGEQSN